MDTEPPVNPNDAPFDTTAIPRGWDRPMTQAEADAANALYPVPPYGQTYFPPVPEPPPAAQGQFVKIDQVQSSGEFTLGVVSTQEGFDLMHEDLIFVLWPIAGVLGIVDDVGARPVRVIQTNPPSRGIAFNFDSSGLDVTGLVLLGFVYTAG